MRAFEDVSLAIEGAVARITVTRAGRLNAMRDQTADEVRAALARVEADTAVRAVVLTGEGRAFGAGYDLSTIQPGQTPRLDQTIEVHFNPLIRAMRASRLPIVAAVNGPCAGASVGIALAADIVMAGRSTYFYEPFVGIALVPDAGNTLFLTRIAGRIRAMPAMLLGDRITAEEAKDWGLVWRVVEDDALLAEAQAIALRLAGLAASAVSATKRLISEAADPDLDARLDRERDLQGEAGRSREMQEAIAAFLARRRA
jgi:2-(1,2-epoxy-1,2-dihydrophenyl)acetyl-CoA isomerase